MAAIDTNTALKFLIGTDLSKATAAAGQVLVLKKDGRAEIYVDTDGTAAGRLRVGDFQAYANLAALNAVENPDTSALYYIQDIQALAVWDSTAGATHKGAFVQVNADTGATGVAFSGGSGTSGAPAAGEVITGASYDAPSRTITFTVGTLSAANITRGNNSNVNADLSAVETDISTLKGDGATTGSVANSIKNAVENLDVSEFALASVNNNVVNIKGIKEVDGKIAIGAGNGINLEEVAYTGAAADVSVADTGSKFTGTTVEAVLAEIQGNVDTLDSSLKAVAKSGNASDVSVADTGGHFTATDVEGALAELAVASAGGVASKTVYLHDDSVGQTDYAKVYNLYQGENDYVKDRTDGKTNPTLIGTINVAKDKVVQDGSVVDITFNPEDNKLYDGVTDVTALIKGETTPTSADAGKYIKLVLQNVTDPLYIAANDLVDIYTPEVGATQIQIAISGSNVISATIVAGSVGTNELANDAVTTAKILNANVTTAKIADDAVTADKVAIAAHTESVTAGADGLAVSVTTTDGQVSSVTASIAAQTYDAYGDAAAVLGTNTDAATANTVYGAKAAASAAQTDVDNLETLVGTLPQGATSSTVVGYIDEKVTKLTTWGTF